MKPISPVTASFVQGSDNECFSCSSDVGLDPSIEKIIEVSDGRLKRNASECFFTPKKKAKLERLLPSTPTKYYPLSPRSHNPIWTPPTKKRIRDESKKDKIFYYIYKNLEDGQTYVGISKNPIKRTYEHASNARADNERRNSPLYEDVRNGKMMQVGILTSLIPEILEELGLSPGEIEQYYIQQKDSFENGYNKTRGGNGVSRVLFDERNAPEYTSPIKRKIPKRTYPMSPSTLRFKIPEEDKHESNVVYGIFEKSTGKIYIGKTIQEISSRAAQHGSNARDEDKVRGQTFLYHAIRLNPRNFALVILQKKIHPAHLRRAETGWIKWGREHLGKENVFNVRL